MGSAAHVGGATGRIERAAVRIGEATERIEGEPAYFGGRVACSKEEVGASQEQLSALERRYGAIFNSPRRLIKLSFTAAAPGYAEGGSERIPCGASGTGLGPSG